VTDRAADPAATTASLQIRRLPTKWRDRAGKYKIMVDGTEVGRLASGGAMVVDVAAGPHTVQARMGAFYGSAAVSVHVADGQQATLAADIGGPPDTAVSDLFHPSSWILLYDESLPKPGPVRLHRRAWILEATVAAFAVLLVVVGAIRGQILAVVMFTVCGVSSGWRAVRRRWSHRASAELDGV